MAEQDFSISVIGEGETDFAVLESILLGYTGQKNLLVTRLHPKEGEPGNWDKVLKYCAGSEFKSAFLVPDAFVVIQIDSDVFGTENVPRDVSIPGMESLSVPEIVLAIKEKINRPDTSRFLQCCIRTYPVCDSGAPNRMLVSASLFSQR